MLEIKNISKNFGDLEVLKGISFGMKRRESLGLLGESGAGKSTLARIILGLIAKDSGDIFYNGKSVDYSCRDIKKEFQMVFQDPYTSLNPKIKVGEAIGEPVFIHKVLSGPEIKQRALELLSLVGLPKDFYDRYPHELSGGERQRVGIARALSVNPKLLVLDEPVSSLDLSIQVQVLDLLKRLKDKLGLTYLFIAHDLAVIKYICERVIVMKKGKIVEEGDVATVLASPNDSYTKKLVQSSLG
ncbi:hypothetical protein A2230_02685 [candidate division WOR-1 bacterium RIFOXYA2_FULL_36_21]|uniref:ABC transporter domain-containing protein n=1 Tax=candidate division WOR-1 bacterium RIFOXYB2_FULL_36_35 TaxID=1802578 RepID=A0A1F4RXG0_UNCSA|nr:MAG: hypothetical protein A2230_02685 [candidate division WOR-1 bacterium RIFOXYA2_FULL_36_21]OGC12862.1 MAG: hypothetical protein A2290_02735 [candidate division WOR-1 bacterium RIFOXYB2_FULL_36_35]OGC19934.1 MAG: hypothetical protein A2282_02685 [candidate division WOR-1 bacterium RIFOXYA12_FULL_36_13]